MSDPPAISQRWSGASLSGPMVARIVDIAEHDPGFIRVHAEGWPAVDGRLRNARLITDTLMLLAPAHLASGRDVDVALAQAVQELARSYTVVNDWAVHCGGVAVPRDSPAKVTAFVKMWSDAHADWLDAAAITPNDLTALPVSDGQPGTWIMALGVSQFPLGHPEGRFSV